MGQVFSFLVPGGGEILASLRRGRGRFQEGEGRRDDIPGQTEQSTQPLLYTARRRCVDCWEPNVSGDTAMPGQAPTDCGGLKALTVVWKGRG